MKNICVLLILFLTTSVNLAQSEHFPLKAEESQFSRIEQVVGIDKIIVEFSRPNLKGRTLFGEMIPWKMVWRTGANASTKLEISETMFINEIKVPKGKYSLLSIPSKDGNWKIILNKNTSLWGHYGYKQEEDLLRFQVKSRNSSEYVETFNIVFQNTTKFETNLVIMWGNFRLPIKIEVDRDNVDKRIMASIQQKLNDPKAHKESIISAHVYFFAANYYHQTKRDLSQALRWMNKAIETHKVNYFYYYKSNILASMNRFEDAAKASKEGLEIFKGGSNKEWIWRYEKQIKKWEEKLRKEK